MRKIVVAGSVLVDKINEISAYPKAGELTLIRSLSRVPGGLVPNTGRDIRILAPEIPVAAFGKVGDDDEGRFAVAEMRKEGMDVSGVIVSKNEATSFTDVMSVADGERTFFTYAGACATWGYDDFPFDLVSEGDIVLLGYFLLLAKIDAGDGLKILRELKRRGVMTTIDLVTENSNRYGLVKECLPYVDYLIVNEVEASRIMGFGEVPENDMPSLCKMLLDAGVRERVVIHMPSRGFTMTKDGKVTECRSFHLPEGFIKGKTGAGDAYCAGALVGIVRGYDDEEILRTGATAAVGALSAPGAVEGMKKLEDLKEIVKCW